MRMKMLPFLISRSCPLSVQIPQSALRVLRRILPQQQMLPLKQTFRGFHRIQASLIPFLRSINAVFIIDA